MLPRARVRGAWSSTPSALQEFHGGQIRGAHPCEKRKDGAASSCGHPWSRSGRWASPRFCLYRCFPQRIPLSYVQQYHTQQHLGRPKAPQALDGSASPCHLLPAYGKQRRKYSPVFFYNHEDLVEKSGEVIQEDFEGSLMDVDASGHRWIKELAYSFRQSTSCERFFEKSASCFEFALLDTRVVFVSGRIEHFHLRPYRC